MRFEPGQTIVRRFRHPDGRIGGVYSGRVISDDVRGLLVWLHADAEALRQVTFDGTPARPIPYLELLNRPLHHQPGVWHSGGGSALALTPPASPYSVLWFFDPDGAFSGWYVNLEAPATRWWGGVDMHDQQLDVLVARDRTWEWKDADEFAAHTGHPLFWDEVEAAQIRAAGEAAIALIEAQAFPFDGTWCDFRPDPAWPPTAMPWWWDRPLFS